MNCPHQILVIITYIIPINSITTILINRKHRGEFHFLSFEFLLKFLYLSQIVLSLLTFIQRTF